MALQVWLPLNGNLDNRGLSDVTITNNGAVVDNNGKIGKCYYFNGSSYIRITVPTAITSIKNLTIAAWVKSTSTTLALGGLSHDAGNNTIGSCTLYSSGWQFSNNGSWGYVTGGSIANTSIWKHVCCTVDNTTITTYLNGIQVASAAIVDKSAMTNLNSSNFIEIGCDHPGGDEYLTGYVNDFRVYDHALSPKEVHEISKGLVAHYKLDDIYSEPTTNLFKPNPCRGGSRWSPLGNGVKIDWTSNAGDTYWYLDLASGVTLTQGATYTFSCKCTGIGANTIMFRWCNLAGYEVYLHNGWNQYTFQMPATNITNPFFDDINRDTSLSNLQIYDFQLEAKDHATGYTPTSRAESIIYDSSGYNHDGIINGALQISTNTSRYSMSTVFNGTDNSIKIPFNDMVINGDYTISVWTYKTEIGSKGYQTILGGPSGFELEARNAGGTDPQFVGWNWGKPTATYEFNKWTLFTFVRTSSNSKLYVNGELKATGNAATIPTGNYYIGAWNTATQQNYQGLMSDFRIYVTALSDADILELYKTAAVVDNQQNLYAYEFVEDDDAQIYSTGVVKTDYLTETTKIQIHKDGQVKANCLYEF